MTKKKRRRKEQHHQRGNPPPPQKVTPRFDPYEGTVALPPDDLLLDHGGPLDAAGPADVLNDMFELGGPSLFADDPTAIGPDYHLRPMERNLMRMQRYLERKGITVTGENEHDVEALLERGEWREVPEQYPSTQLERAQMLVYEAFELPEAQWPERISLAKEALKLSRNCADAHVLLAELDAANDKAAQRHYMQAVKAAHRALSDVDVMAHPRDYWHLMKARPLLRALNGAAYIHTVLGDHEQAIGMYRRLFEIDQLDVMDVRDGYVGLLMIAGRDEEVSRFLEQQGRTERLSEENPHIQYTYPLVLFRLEGDTEAARAALHTAQAGNAQITRYLLGDERVPLDALILPGEDQGEASAVKYLVYDCHLWLRTPNAIEWLRQNVTDNRLRET